MLYLLYGNVEYLINKEIEKIIKESNIEEININKYELDSTNFKEIIDDASTISLFDDKKIIIVDNAYIFTSSNKAGDISLFEEYIANYNPNTILIFKLKEDKKDDYDKSVKLDERKKIVKLIRKVGVVKDFNKEEDPTKIVKNMFEDYEISKEDINFLIDRVGTDIYLLQEEINKIKLYKDTNHKVTRTDITLLTNNNIDADLNKLVDSLISNKKEEAISLYNEMLKHNLEPIGIIISLANKYRLMYQAKELALRGYREEEICKELNQTNPKYMYVLIKLGKNYSSKDLLNLINELSILDYDIKRGNVNPALAFELFILKK